MTAVEARGLPALDRRDFVPADEVDRVVERTRAELDELGAALDAAEASAAEAERRLDAEPLAPSDKQAIAQVEGIIASMRVAAERECAAALELARTRAAARLADARAEAEALLATVRPAPLEPVAPPVEPVTQAEPITAQNHSPAAAAPASSPWAPVGAPAEAPGPVTVAWRADDRADDEVIDLDAPETAPSTTVSGPAPDAPVAAPLAPVVVPDLPPRPRNDGFAGLAWLPIEAVLPMVALVMLLIVVLAWMG